MPLRVEVGSVHEEVNNPTGLNADDDLLIHGPYFWNSTSVEEDDSWNVIKPDSIDAEDPGRWEMKPRTNWTIPGSGYQLLNHGNIRTVFANGTLNSSGEITINLTEDGTSNGDAIFGNTIYNSTLTANIDDSGGAVIEVEFGCVKVWGANNKTVTFKAVKGKNMLLLGDSLAAGLEGVAVTISVTGERLTRP